MCCERGVHASRYFAQAVKIIPDVDVFSIPASRLQFLDHEMDCHNFPQVSQVNRTRRTDTRFTNDMGMLALHPAYSLLYLITDSGDPVSLHCVHPFLLIK